MSDLNKPRFLTLPLDYFKAKGRVPRWRRRLAWWAFGGSLAWLVVSGLTTKEMHLGASPGHVSSPHQAWDRTCSACHEPFEVISSHSFAPPLMEHSSGQKCQTCHQGPAHHPGQKPDLNCAACHREHRGPDHSLTKLHDADCTQCHNNLANHGKVNDFADVSRFAHGTHPEFRSIKSDPGRLRFNHALHMTPGMAGRSEAGFGGSVFTLGMIPKGDRDRYAQLATQKDKSDEAAVQLDCRACHQLSPLDFLSLWQASELGPAAVPLRTTGAYFQPITYEANCKVCHPLQVAQEGPKDLIAVTVPHRMQPADLEPWMRRYFMEQAVKGLTGFWEKKVTRPLPGKTLAEALPPDRQEWVTNHLEGAKADLYLGGKKNCSLCHDIELNDFADPRLKKKKVVKADEPYKPPFVHSAQINSVWLKHARFDHMAHRGVECRECHGNAYATAADGKINPKASVTNKDVLVPGMDNCVRCHAPASSRDGQPSGGVRHDCVLCHTYHNGENPYAGRGAAARGAAWPGRIEDFLKGVRKGAE